MKRALNNLILILFVLGMIIGAGYYLTNQSLYVTSEIAQVTAEMVPVYPDQAGVLKEWAVEEGDSVEEGQILGTETLLQSGQPSGDETDAPSTQSITSPFSGVLVKSNAVPGKMVKPGQPVAMVADLSNKYIVAYIDETEIDRVKPGKKVDITVDAYKDRIFKGKVQKIGSTAGDFTNPSASTDSQNENKVVQRVPVQIVFDEQIDVNLMPGMNAEVKIQS
ncbi:efflux RND transporter periplasmic adaptor subunit [Thermoactinomyces intermedius]|uniref:Efflux RND transporter periplasmic adaptor subunit n=1 Tax=Thermoactinomyces intermedius TaxID=2024 RepID=A0A8I1A7J2_THEIN|nr:MULTISPECIES: HlyD family efflux transporter periplasmic adaptor subunit [Thermoactinomyces]MBA4549955.1 efflux RND transporter periplasmic adaptor subunit [Thermoactinomyces intermedius]MBA4835619.1 efflux RND transporter periplasmic adaptor subunit [Thermoactinomyces intermedius]MBH8596284.1 efflux RND transporter periplasmic adaptor subunit [Thermoactinomyces intermedius]MBH8600567.1 efflux RND transporter periplasmic adaptor subunit [Thermoactinomyces sp. CICC 23799]